MHTSSEVTVTKESDGGRCLRADTLALIKNIYLRNEIEFEY